MKLIKSILICFIVVAFSAHAEYIPRDYYYVVSDVSSDSVESGKCIVRGYVTDPFKDEGIQGALVSNLTRSSHAFTDENGFYEITIPASDTTVFFYHKNYKEIVCWSYPFQSGHIVTMNFVADEKLPDGMIRSEEKPVIYLYPEIATDVSIQLDKNLVLTSTYPQYDKAWNVTAHPNGTIEHNNRTYPYLFWEGQSEIKILSPETHPRLSFFIQTDTCIQFLENTLAKAGFNERESTDFITYWGTRIQKYTYANLDFYIDNQCIDQIGSHSYFPKPDNMRRLFMVFTGSEIKENSNVNTQAKLGNFKREGFTVVEWGGSELTPRINP